MYASSSQNYEEQVPSPITTLSLVLAGAVGIPYDPIGSMPFNIREG